MSSRKDGIARIAKLMAAMDFCMLTTRTMGGRLHARPMSNNGEVEFDGHVWFFSSADTRKLKEIEHDSHVELSYADPKSYRFISMSGTAEIIRDVDKKRALWLAELERWFEGGPENEDIVLIKVAPDVVEYWNGEDGGEIDLS